MSDSNKTIVITKANEIVTDKKEQNRLIKFYHESELFGGHCGTKRLQKQLQDKYYWRGMTRQISKYVKNCDKCTLNKPKQRTKTELAITPTPEKPFDSLIVDTVGPLTTTNLGNKYILTLICDLSKYLICVPIPNKEANTIARAIVENVILNYGPVKSIRTDLGTEYKNSVVKELCELLQIEHHFSTPFHHETLGSIERSHRSMNEYLRSYLTDENWEIYIRYFAFCYNISYTAANGHTYTPFELVYGRKCNLPEELARPIEPVYNFENFVKIAKQNFQISHKIAKTEIERLKQSTKTQYDNKINPIEINKNDLILIRNEPYNKFNNIYSGPFNVTNVDKHNVTYLNGNKEKSVHKNRIVKYRP